MIDYQISFNRENNTYNVQTNDPNFVNGSIPVNIPDTDKRKRQFISLFLHKADVEEGLGFLFCMSADKHIQINQALFISALANMMKCFQTSKVCNKINENGFLSEYSDEKDVFLKYKNWRNKHYIHDENSMRESIAFLLVAPKGSEKVLGGQPSVIWNRSPIDFIGEGRQLEILMQKLWKYICKEIDQAGEGLIKEYGQKTYEELMTYGIAQIKLATLENPERSRI